MAIIDYQTGEAVLGEFALVSGSPHANPSAAYNTWAAALGVSNTATLSSFTDTDTEALLLSLGFVPLSGPSSVNQNVLVSTEGFISFRTSNYPSTTQYTTSLSGDASTLGLQNAVKFTAPDSIIVSVKYFDYDTAVTAFKWQKSGTTAIIHMRYGLWDDTALFPIEVSYKITPGKVEVVFLAPVEEWRYDNLYFQVMRQDSEGSTSNLYSGSGAFYTNVLPLATYHYETGSSDVVRVVNSSITSTQFGTPLHQMGFANSLHTTNFGQPAEMGINWPGGALPAGWSNIGGQRNWEYDAAEGRTVLGSLRLTLYETDTYGTLISNYYPLASGGKFKFWIKRSRISAADCRIIFQAIGQTDIESVFDQPTGEYVAVESPFLPSGNWRVQLQGRNNSAGVITSFWIDDFTVESGSVAQSLYSTHFGIPVRTNAFEASSLHSTVISSAAIAFPTRQRNSLRSSRFGAHLAVGAEQRCFANSLISSRFGRPVRLPTFEFRAAGWAGSRFGVPMLGGWKPRIIYNIIVSAEPTRTTQFGTPTLGP